MRVMVIGVLADSMVTCCGHMLRAMVHERAAMGPRSREPAVDRFDVTIVNATILEALGLS